MKNLLGMLMVAGVLASACGGAQNEPPGDSSESSATAGETGDPTGGQGACAGKDGCYSCEPEDSLQLLNACTDASCAPFANTKERLPLLSADGKLPPLP